MPHYKNFAQCVGQLLKKHQLTVSALGAQIGARSELRRALHNSLSSARRASLCKRICLSVFYPPHSRMNRWRRAAFPAVR